MENRNSKQVEAWKDKEELEAPPPTYQEASTSLGDTDINDYQTIDKQALPHEEELPLHSPEEGQIEQATRMLKEKGPVLPQRPASRSPPLHSPTPRRNSAFVESLSKAEDKIEAMSTPEDEKKAIPPVEEEQKATKVELYQPPPAAQVEVFPSLPQRPSWPAPHPPQPNVGNMPLEYTFDWSRPLLDFPTLSIYSTSGASLPSSLPDMPPTSHWRLNYHSKYFARLQRYAYRGSNEAEHDMGDFPFRQVAEIKYPDFIWPPCKAHVTLEPREEEVFRKGSTDIKRLDRVLQCNGWLNHRYSIDLPILGDEKIEWKTPRKFLPSELPETDGRAPSPYPLPGAIPKDSVSATANMRLLTVGDIIELTKNRLNDEAWTPFPVQHLISSTTPSQPLATYQRASPWARHSGSLVILPPTDLSTLTPEYIEGIIIATTAMVGMQDRIGFANHLLEVGSLEYAEKKRAREIVKGRGTGRRIEVEEAQLEGRTKRKSGKSGSWWKGGEKKEETAVKRRGSSLLEKEVEKDGAWAEPETGEARKEAVRFA